MLQDFLVPGVLVYATGRKEEEACMWQIWQGYHSRVLSWSSLISPLIFSGLLQNICLKKSESLAESYLKQNNCHACHRRFALFFPLPSCFFRVKTVPCEHAMLKITKSSFPWSKKSAFVIFSQLTNPRRYTSRNLFSAEHLARVRPCPWVAASQTVYFVRHDIFVSQGT